MESNLEPVIYYIILGISISYLYRAIKQIITKDILFYRQELYTDESVEKWAVIDGIIKGSFALICGIYGILCLLGNKGFWYVIVYAALMLVLYLLEYKKTLVRRPDSPSQPK